MIKCKDGMVEVKGDSRSILADFSVIVRCLRSHFDKEDIEYAFRIGLMDEEMLDKEIDKAEKELANLMMEMMPREVREAMVREILTGMKGNE